MNRTLHRVLTTFAGSCLLATQLTCTPLLDACTETDSTLAFFSQGDCIFTNATYFRGHEWLTFLANEDVPRDDRFSSGDIDAIIEGNRRVDFPKELLVHLNSSIPDYLNALIDHHDRKDNQAIHFLLDERNRTPEAAENAYQLLIDLTDRAVTDFNTRPLRSLTHMVQDSFSHAHSSRESDNADAPWCVRKVKAYIERAPGFDTPDIEFHGTDDDSVGHVSTEDSIYRTGRDCADPQGKSQVKNCLSEEAKRAQEATTAYLVAVRTSVRQAPREPIARRAFVEKEVRAFIASHLHLCEGAN